MDTYKLGLALSIFAISLAGCSTASTKLNKRDRAEALVNVANAAIAEKDHVGALETLLQAEKEDPTFPPLYHSKAIVFYLKQDLPKAIENAKKAVELRPDYSEANNTLGKLYIDAGKYELAQPPLLQAATDPLNREAYKAYTNLGIISYRRDDAEKAEDYFSRAITSSAQYSCIAYYYRGHVRMKSGKLSDAIKDYDSASKRYCTTFAEAHLALGIAYEQSKQYGLARKKYLDIQKNYPDSKVAEQAVTRLRYLP